MSGKKKKKNTAKNDTSSKEEKEDNSEKNKNNSRKSNDKIKSEKETSPKSKENKTEDPQKKEKASIPKQKKTDETNPEIKPHPKEKKREELNEKGEMLNETKQTNPNPDKEKKDQEQTPNLIVGSIQNQLNPQKNFEQKDQQNNVNNFNNINEFTSNNAVKEQANIAKIVIPQTNSNCNNKKDVVIENPIQNYQNDTSSLNFRKETFENNSFAMPVDNESKQTGIIVESSNESKKKEKEKIYNEVFAYKNNQNLDIDTDDVKNERYFINSQNKNNEKEKVFNQSNIIPQIIKEIKEGREKALLETKYQNAGNNQNMNYANNINYNNNMNIYDTKKLESQNPSNFNNNVQNNNIRNINIGNINNPIFGKTLETEIRNSQNINYQNTYDSNIRNNQIINGQNTLETYQINNYNPNNTNMIIEKENLYNYNNNTPIPYPNTSETPIINPDYNQNYNTPIPYPNTSETPIINTDLNNNYNQNNNIGNMINTMNSQPTYPIINNNIQNNINANNQMENNMKNPNNINQYNIDNNIRNDNNNNNKYEKKKYSINRNLEKDPFKDTNNNNENISETFNKINSNLRYNNNNNGKYQYKNDIKSVIFNNNIKDTKKNEKDTHILSNFIYNSMANANNNKKTNENIYNNNNIKENNQEQSEKIYNNILNEENDINKIPDLNIENSEEYFDNYAQYMIIKQIIKTLKNIYENNIKETINDIEMVYLMDLANKLSKKKLKKIIKIINGMKIENHEFTMKEYKKLLMKMNINKNLIQHIWGRLTSDSIIKKNLYDINENNNENEDDTSSLITSKSKKDSANENKIIELKESPEKNKNAVTNISKDTFLKLYLEKEKEKKLNNEINTFINKKRKNPNIKDEKIEILIRKYSYLEKIFKNQIINVLKEENEEILKEYINSKNINIKKEHKDEAENDNKNKNFTHMIIIRRLYELKIKSTDNFEIIIKTEPSNNNNLIYNHIIKYNEKNEKLYTDEEFIKIIKEIAKIQNIFLPIYKNDIIKYLEDKKRNQIDDEIYINEMNILINKVNTDYKIFKKKFPNEIEPIPYIDPGFPVCFKFKNKEKSNYIQEQDNINNNKIIVDTDDKKINKPQYIELHGYQKDKKETSKNNKEIKNINLKKNNKSVVKLRRNNNNNEEKKNKSTTKIQKKQKEKEENEQRITNYKEIEINKPKLEEIQNSYKNINWDYEIEFDENNKPICLRYYNLNNIKDEMIFYYVESLDLWFIKNKVGKLHIKQEEINYIKKLQAKAELLEEDEYAKNIPCKKAIDKRIYFNNNKKTYDLLFNFFKEKDGKSFNEKNMYNPYYQNKYFKTVDESINKYRNIFVSETIEKCILINYPDKYFVNKHNNRSNIQDRTNKAIFCFRCNECISNGTLNRHLLSKHKLESNFEINVMSDYETKNKSNVKKTSSKKTIFKQIIQNLYKIIDKRKELESLIDNLITKNTFYTLETIYNYDVFNKKEFFENIETFNKKQINYYNTIYNNQIIPINIMFNLEDIKKTEKIYEKVKEKLENEYKSIPDIPDDYKEEDEEEEEESRNTKKNYQKRSKKLSVNKNQRIIFDSSIENKNEESFSNSYDIKKKLNISKKNKPIQNLQRSPKKKKDEKHEKKQFYNYEYNNKINKNKIIKEGKDYAKYIESTLNLNNSSKKSKKENNNLKTLDFSIINNLKLTSDDQIKLEMKILQKYTNDIFINKQYKDFYEFKQTVYTDKEFILSLLKSEN